MPLVFCRLVKRGYLGVNRSPERQLREREKFGFTRKLILENNKLTIRSTLRKIQSQENLIKKIHSEESRLSRRLTLKKDQFEESQLWRKSILKKLHSNGNPLWRKSSLKKLQSKKIRMEDLLSSNLRFLRKSFLC